MEIDLNRAAAGMIRQIHSQMTARGYKAANELRNAAHQVLEGQRHGRVYKRPFSQTTYTASAPGEAPANRTRAGGLRMSFQAESESAMGGRNLAVKAAVVTDKEYAPLLQEGTGRIAARPFREPIIERAKPRVEAIFRAPYL